MRATPGSLPGVAGSTGPSERFLESHFAVATSPDGQLGSALTASTESALKASSGSALTASYGSALTAISGSALTASSGSALTGLERHAVVELSDLVEHRTALGEYLF